ncbi:hypothetical protein HII17_07215 [Thalassotalea sp. M1531]|uniref:Uncharacterized protein n=1 Tax=Thalassotalea algicola TaxID=2716224 RepID=A0A7Y0LC19_9GAMM|nr:hypothetical protein [Thalassotalea algicola]NMP31347.1 hypothetical protein [Thalassotalea algicola]
MRKFIFLLAIMALPFSASAIENCTESEEGLVRNKLDLSKNPTPYTPFKVAQHYQPICKIHTPEMMDGLSYLLYKDTNSNAYFVSIYNGLDGSYTMHGPFSK